MLTLPKINRMIGRRVGSLRWSCEKSTFSMHAIMIEVAVQAVFSEASELSRGSRDRQSASRHVFAEQLSIYILQCCSFKENRARLRPGSLTTKNQ